MNVFSRHIFMEMLLQSYKYRYYCAFYEINIIVIKSKLHPMMNSQKNAWVHA